MEGKRRREDGGKRARKREWENVKGYDNRYYIPILQLAREESTAYSLRPRSQRTFFPNHLKLRTRAPRALQMFKV